MKGLNVSDHAWHILFSMWALTASEITDNVKWGDSGVVASELVCIEQEMLLCYVLLMELIDLRAIVLNEV